MVVVPRVSSLHPRFGPIAGGTRLVISGTWFNAGNSVRVVLNGVIGTECTIMWVMLKYLVKGYIHCELYDSILVPCQPSP